MKIESADVALIRFILSIDPVAQHMQAIATPIATPAGTDGWPRSPACASAVERRSNTIANAMVNEAKQLALFSDTSAVKIVGTNDAHSPSINGARARVNSRRSPLALGAARTTW